MRIVIIGNGIAGITTARHVRKLSGHEVIVISGETPYFFSRTALMYVYMGHMKMEHTQPYENWFWKKNRIRLIHDYVDQIDFPNKQCRLKGGEKINYDKLVIATGSKSNTIGIPFSQYKGVQGLYHWQDLQLMEQNTAGISSAVIIGGGLIGIEMAEMLHSRGIHATFLVMEKSYWNNALPWEESQMITRHIRSRGIEVKTETQLSEILQDETGRVRGVITKQGEEIACQFLGITAGVSPNIDFVRQSTLSTNRGIVVNEYFETNEKDVYAAGDCAEFLNPNPGQLRIEQLWYTGRMQGEVLAQNLCGQRIAYDRGIWFNSAKFIHIEYQTYGVVPPVLPPSFDSFYWENSDNEKAIRIVFRRDDYAVTGINSLGIRLRHPVCEQWIAAQRSVAYVISHWQQANFDPEFYPSYEKEIRFHFGQEKRAIPETQKN
jgi:NAD(P)H-nitrite reductase large subunit